jgi:histidinol-phosphatase
VTATDIPAWSEDLALAHRLAEVASRVSLDHFGSSRNWVKADGTPVGEADLAVDRVLCELIRTACPDDAILSEESAPVGASARRWILDPIDGTVFFLAGEDSWGTHIALEDHGEVVLGLVTRPVLSEIWWACRGTGAWMGKVQNGQVRDRRRLGVSGVDRLSESRVTVWSFEPPSELVARLQAGARWCEPSTSCLFDLLRGDIEGVCARGGGPWDHAPAAVLVEEAGGRFADPAGGRRLDLGGAVYTNGRIHDELAVLMSGC